MTPIKVAAVQASSCAYSLYESLHKLARLVDEASEQGASLIVFPEAFLSAYPRHLGYAIGRRTEEQRAWYAKYLESAVKIPANAVGKKFGGLAFDPNELDDLKKRDEFSAFKKICTIAQDSQKFLSIGIIERSLIGATLWCSNILISPEGVLLSLHRKLQPTACERVVWSQGHAFNKDQQATNLPVVSTSIGKIGGLICWENFMPLPRYALYQKGVEIWTAPTADARPTWAPSMQHIAQEGRCFVISANQFHKPSDFPSDYPANSASDANKSDATKAEVWSRGGSVIVDPLGNILAGPLWDEEGIIYATIDTDTIPGMKLDFDPVGHYAREDLFDFSVPTDRT